MIEEIVNEVSQKTGLSPEQSRAAVESVIGFLKTKLPAPLASGLDSLVNGDPGAEGGLAGEAAAVLGSLFHKNS